MIVTKKRSFIKDLSWRVIGSIDTFILSLIIINFSSENYTYDLAFYIATLEVITKTIIPKHALWAGVPITSAGLFCRRMVGWNLVRLVWQLRGDVVAKCRGRSFCLWNQLGYS